MSIMTDPKRRLAPALPGTPGSNDAHPRRKNVGTACSACKARKLKCTGTAPCANCVKSRLECTLDQTLDKRRRGALKRKIDQLEEKEDILFRLVSVLRESGNRSTIPLLNLIRSNASLPEIQYYLNHQVTESELALVPELIEVSHEVQRLQEADSRSVRRILDAKRLSDQPLFQVPAKPWTSVVSDNDFVSHLISLWFTWFHPFANWLDRDRFVYDMQVGLLGAKYCSPFLVNAILAYACTYSDYPEAYAVPGDVSSKGAHFYDEAKRLLDKEEGRISLPTVQGIGVFWVRACMIGQDRQAWIYRNQLVYSANELSQKYTVLTSKASEDEPRMAQVVNHTSWGLFNSATTHALLYEKTPNTKPPQQPYFLPVNHEPNQQEWQPYPTPADGTPSHSTCLFNELCTLNVIAYDVADFYFRKEAPRSRPHLEQKTSEFHGRLNEWVGRLPQCVKTGNDTELPHILCLHMYYHAILITIYNPHRLSRETPIPYPKHDTISPAQALGICLSSARNIGHWMQMYRTTWGLEYMPIFNTQWIQTALFILLENLEKADNCEAFIILSIAAKAFSRRFEKAKRLLRSLQDTARDLKINLPVEVAPLFTGIDDQWPLYPMRIKEETSDTVTYDS
ncbi:C6 transcription factor [Aspergillus bertholletiae]|uniref:C6 transcription factor n=1 Tax=Aspergillus bertholletiae TaxID=1226010 RepID=A0A5N7B0X3_9EURO|nr:C6 transcription factor [Aspergillus bertholletiae]